MITPQPKAWVREFITEDNMIARGFKIAKNEREGVNSALGDWGQLQVEYIFGYKYFRIWGITWQKEMKYIDEIDAAYLFLTGKTFIL